MATGRHSCRPIYCKRSEITSARTPTNAPISRAVDYSIWTGRHRIGRNLQSRIPPNPTEASVTSPRSLRSRQPPSSFFSADLTELDCYIPVAVTLGGILAPRWLMCGNRHAYYLDFSYIKSGILAPRRFMNDDGHPRRKSNSNGAQSAHAGNTVGHRGHSGSC